MQVIKIKKSCPYCKEFKVIKRGKYFVRSKPHNRQKYSCSNCGRFFNHFRLLNVGHVFGWDTKVYSQVMKLINKKGYYSSKHDHSKRDKIFLSSRAIMKIVKKGRVLRGNAVSPHSVCKLIREHRVEV